MRISETPSPTGSQSPKLPYSAERMRAMIRAFPIGSRKAFNQASNSGVRRKVFISECIRTDTSCQAGADRCNEDVGRKSWGFLPWSYAFGEAFSLTRTESKALFGGGANFGVSRICCTRIVDMCNGRPDPEHLRSCRVGTQFVPTRPPSAPNAWAQTTCPPYQAGVYHLRCAEKQSGLQG